MLRAILLALLLPASAAAVELEGTLAQGGMAIGRTAPGSEVRLDGEPVKVAADGRFVIGFGRDARREHLLEVMRPDGTLERIPVMIAERDFPIERIDGLPPETVTPPPEYYERRRREMGMVHDARAVLSDLLAWSEGFLLPAQGRISGVYGSQRILNGEPRSPHYGLDVAAPTGTPVRAPAAGVVRLAETDFLLEGGIVIIDHGFGVSSTLFHLSRVDVESGQRVERGERIGAVGATGRASGAHVDWRVNWRDVRLDPALLIKEADAGEVTP